MVFLVRKKHRLKKVYLFQKVYLLRGFLKSRVGNDAEHICGLDHPYERGPGNYFAAHELSGHP